MQIWHVSIHIFPLAYVFTAGLNLGPWVDNGHMESRQSLGLAYLCAKFASHVSELEITNKGCLISAQTALLIHQNTSTKWFHLLRHTFKGCRIYPVGSNQSDQSEYRLKRFFKFCTFFAPTHNKSAPEALERVSVCIPAVERCMYTMQTGTQMSKLKGKKNGLIRFFYLDEHKSCIRWRPSKKQDKAKSELSA